MLLKEVPGVLPSLENSAIARSGLWEREVTEIIPHQLQALRWLAIDSGEEDVDLYFDFLMNALRGAASRGLIPEDARILKYTRPRQLGILESELIEGLKNMPPAMARAAVFGLEMDIPLERLTTMTFKQANSMELTPLASKVVSSLIPTLGNNLAFWTKEHGYLSGMANEIYANFNMTWNALRMNYKAVIPDNFDGLVDN